MQPTNNAQPVEQQQQEKKPTIINPEHELHGIKEDLNYLVHQELTAHTDTKNQVNLTLSNVEDILSKIETMQYQLDELHDYHRDNQKALVRNTLIDVFCTIIFTMVACILAQLYMWAF